MKTIILGSKEGIIDTKHIVVDVPVEGVILDFVSIIEDVIITSPQGDILMCWDLKPGEEFKENESLLLKTKDNMKEFADVNCTQLALKPLEGLPLKVYVTVQNN
jgi:hypothetical protein